MEFRDFLNENAVLIDLQESNKNKLLTQMAQYMASIYNLRDEDVILRKILEREDEMSTGIGFGIAFPHARIDSIDKIYLIAARSVIGINFNAIDERPVHLLFMMISPTASTEHTRILSSLSRIMSNVDNREKLFSAVKPEQFLDLLAGFAHQITC